MYSTIISYTQFKDNTEHYSEPILNLIIYNENSEYERKMKTILDEYLCTVPNLLYYFITLKPQDHDIIINDHVMYINGIESAHPGCLDKTLKAIIYCNKNMSFKYIIRSNISTVIDFSKKFDNSNYDYGGCNIINLQWLDPDYGINDHSLKGTLFSQGTYIFLSKNAVEYLIKNIDKINRNVIDDVAFGDFFRNKFIPQQIGFMVINQDTKGALCYRNRTEYNRNVDVDRMKKIVHNLIYNI
jgi:hypothetical protein